MSPGRQTGHTYVIRRAIRCYTSCDTLLYTYDESNLVSAADNPYRPGFSQVPEMLAGRDKILDAAEEAREVAAAGRTPRPILLVGGRGVGKTVLLAEIGSRAGATHGWPRLRVEAAPSTPLLPQVLSRIDSVTALLEAQPRPSRLRPTEATVRAGVAGVGAEIRFECSTTQGAEGPLQLEIALRRLAVVAAHTGSGVVVTVDETQLARRPDVAAVAAALQAGTEEGWPYLVVFAGLATMRNPSRSVTYLERGEWHEIGPLDETSTMEAITIPAAAAGRPIDPVAAQYLAEQTGGYPYAIQLFGHHAWMASNGQPRITYAAARIAAQQASRELEAGLYASRWTQASPREQQYLTAVAQLVSVGATVTGAAVASQLGTTTRKLSSYRDRLLTKGTLVINDRTLRFAVPGMAAYVQRHTNEIDPRR
jgi:hypothetical protein